MRDEKSSDLISDLTSAKEYVACIKNFYLQPAIRGDLISSGLFYKTNDETNNICMKFYYLISS